MKVRKESTLRLDIMMGLAFTCYCLILVSISAVATLAALRSSRAANTLYLLLGFTLFGLGGTLLPNFIQGLAWRTDSINDKLSATVPVQATLVASHVATYCLGMWVVVTGRAMTWAYIETEAHRKRRKRRVRRQAMFFAVSVTCYFADVATDFLMMMAVSTRDQTSIFAVAVGSTMAGVAIGALDLRYKLLRILHRKQMRIKDDVALPLTGERLVEMQGLRRHQSTVKRKTPNKASYSLQSESNEEGDTEGDTSSGDSSRDLEKSLESESSEEGGFKSDTSCECSGDSEESLEVAVGNANIELGTSVALQAAETIQRDKAEAHQDSFPEGRKLQELTHAWSEVFLSFF